jgi:hypothetical protein
MAPPSQQVIYAAVEAIYKDASSRKEEAERLGVAARAADGLRLDQRAMSAPADWVGMVDAYRDLQLWLADLLYEAAEVHAGIGEALQTAADGYLDDEAQAVHALNGKW